MPNRRNRRARPPTGPMNRGFREGRFEVRGENVWEMSDDTGLDPRDDSAYPDTAENDFGYVDSRYNDAGYADYSDDGFDRYSYDDDYDYEQSNYEDDYYSEDYHDNDQTQVLPVYNPQAFENSNDAGYFEPEFAGEYAQDYADTDFEYPENYSDEFVDDVEDNDVIEEPVSQARHSAAAQPTRRTGAHSRAATRSRRSESKHSNSRITFKKPEKKFSESAFAQRYRSIIEQFGWRAYAIPILVVITIWVLIDVVTPPKDNPVPVNGAGQSINSSANVSDPGLGPDPATAQAPTLPVTELPAGGTFTMTGSGTYRTVGVPGAQRGEGKERTFTYVVEIENGIDTSAYGGDDAFATLIDATLTNIKGWTNDSRYRFEHIQETEELQPDLRIQLTSVETTHSLCGTDIEMETSCFYGEGGRVVINESRWVRGATPFQGDLGAYRQYLINHEVGHGIGYAEHVPCGGQGKLAPIMMQQTLSLSNSELAMIDPNEVYSDDGLVCVSNPWPYPHA